MIGREAAGQVIADHETSDLMAIVKAQGLVVEILHPWEARFEDTYFYPCIFVPKDLSPAAFRTRVAHMGSLLAITSYMAGIKHGSEASTASGAGSRSIRRKSSRPG